jgi:ABC-type multidrug transport system ATPase subunit
VSLARACYRDADIYLLDDVLSALDAKVAATVFAKVLSRSTGILRDKTVVLVTHAHWCLPEADNLLVIDHGLVVARGTFRDITSRQAAVWQSVMGTADSHGEEGLIAGGGAEEEDGESLLGGGGGHSGPAMGSVMRTNQLPVMSSVGVAAPTKKLPLYEVRKVAQEGDGDGRGGVPKSVYLTFVK